MNFGVVIFPGSNCDHDVIYVLKEILDQDVIELWHKDISLQDVDAIILPGGFSFGDYLRSGAIARHSSIMEKVIEFANSGGFVFGICNGFQVLCETGLLPGALLHNDNQKFICKNTFIKAENKNTIYSENGRKTLKIPIAHGEGRYYTDKKTLETLQINNQILFRYCTEDGTISQDANPNGSVENIAGICNLNKNVYGMMPHPERASDDELGNTDGRFIFETIIKNLKSQKQ
jgi:phosphoribosylformylglycinamidine synthase